jgi:hypothetical protein
MENGGHEVLETLGEDCDGFLRVLHGDCRHGSGLEVFSEPLQLHEQGE